MKESYAFFTDRESALVSSLVDMILPADDRSCSASDAGVVSYLDGLVSGSGPGTRERMRLGLAWFDAEARRLSGTTFADADEGIRRSILDAVASAASQRPPGSVGAFFNWLRHETAVGFWTSEAGYADLAVPRPELCDLPPNRPPTQDAGITEITRLRSRRPGPPH